MAGNRVGYCSLCRSEHVDAINKLIGDGNGYTNAQRALSTKVRFSKGTFLRHKGHVTSALITEAEAARKHPIIKPQSTRAGLEMIRDIGVKKAIENPEQVKVDHALRAAKILMDTERKSEAFFVVLAKSVQAEVESPDDFIEGEFREIEENG